MIDTPWGPSQFSETIIDGLVRHHTAGHGGIKATEALNAVIPIAARDEEGWYEEDCAAAIPIKVHAAAILAARPWGDRTQAHIDSAVTTIVNTFPELAELLGCPTPTLETSYTLRARELKERHEHNWQVIRLIEAGPGIAEDSLGLHCERKRVDGTVEYCSVIVTRDEFSRKGTDGFSFMDRNHYPPLPQPDHEEPSPAQ